MPYSLFQRSSTRTRIKNLVSQITKTSRFMYFSLMSIYCSGWCCSIDTFSTTSEIVLNVLSSFLLVTNLATLCLNVRGNVQALNDVWNGIVPGTEVVVVDSLGKPNILFLCFCIFRSLIYIKTFKRQIIIVGSKRSTVCIRML